MPIYLKGPSVLGFFSFCENDFGNPNSPPCRITPSCVGSAILPFECPCCHKTIDFTDAQKRAECRDPRAGKTNYFCPSCGLRFYLGNPRAFAGTIDVRGVAPSLVECVTKGADGPGLQRSEQGDWSGTRVMSRAVQTSSTETAEDDYVLGCDLLGAELEDAKDEHLAIARADHKMAVTDHEINRKQFIVSTIGLGASLAALALAVFARR